ncbi:Protein of unknown function [Bacillus wiedmannii]|nr:Protein of unknown function [Bacillus wiedmannii]
MVEGEE